MDPKLHYNNRDQFLFLYGWNWINILSSFCLWQEEQRPKVFLMGKVLVNYITEHNKKTTKNTKINDSTNNEGIWNTDAFEDQGLPKFETATYLSFLFIPCLKLAFSPDSLFKSIPKYHITIILKCNSVRVYRKKSTVTVIHWYIQILHHVSILQCFPLNVDGIIYHSLLFIIRNPNWQYQIHKTD